MKKMMTVVMLFAMAVSVYSVLYAGDDKAKAKSEKSKAEMEACKKTCDETKEKVEACKAECEKDKEKVEACKAECEKDKEKAEVCKKECEKNKTCHKDSNATSLEIKDMDAFHYVAVEMTGSYELHGEAFGTLYNQAGMQGLDMSAKPMGIYFNDPSNTPVEDLKWDIGFKVPDGTEVKEPLKLKTMPAQKVAVDIYEGPMNEQMNDKFEQIYSDIAKQGYQVQGAMMIWYVSMPVPGEDGSASGKIKIFVPVTKAENK